MATELLRDTTTEMQTLFKGILGGSRDLGRSPSNVYNAWSTAFSTIEFCSES